MLGLAQLATSPSFGQLDRVWNATVAAGISSSLRWVQPLVPPTASFTARRQPPPILAPTSFL